MKSLLVVALAACGPGAAGSNVVVPAEPMIYEFAGDATGIAWSDKGASTNQIRYRELGAPPIVVASIDAAMEPIAIDHDFVYWTRSSLRTFPPVTEVWRWSRTRHAAERLAAVAGYAGALLLRPDAVWVATSVGAFEISREPGPPAQRFTAHDGESIDHFVMLDGRVAVVTTTKREGLAVYAIGTDAPIVTAPWRAFAVVSDGHTLYASDTSLQTEARSTIWSATAGQPLVALAGWSHARGALILVGADEHGLYLADDRATWLRSPTGEMRKLGRRVMHGQLDHGLVYGTTTDDQLDVLLVQER